MNKILTALSLLLVTLSLSGQEIKLKKDAILIDKVPSYNFTKTKGNPVGPQTAMFNLNSHFFLESLEGEKIISFTDTSLYFVQLPNETVKRGAFASMLFTAHQLGKSRMIKRSTGAINYRKYFINELKEYGFFEEGVLSDEVFEDFVKKQDLSKIKSARIHIAKMDSLRLENYAMMEENYGPLLERKPGYINYSEGKITDGGTRIGKVVSEAKGSFSHVYYVINTNDEHVAIINLFQKGQTTKVITGANIYDMKTRNVFDKKFEKDKDDRWPTADEKLKYLCTYLVKVGIL